MTPLAPRRLRASLISRFYALSFVVSACGLFPFSLASGAEANSFLSQMSAQLSQKISENLQYPPAAVAASQEGVAQVALTINRSGRILSVELSKSSGNKLLDDESLAVIRRVASVSAMPASFQPGAPSISVIVPISFELTPGRGQPWPNGKPMPDVARGTEGEPVAKPPRSPWLEARSKRFAAMLQSAPCATLLLPLQVEYKGFDRPTREIMSAQLARAVASDGDCTTDPYLVDLALGEGDRQRSAEAVSTLASALRANRVISSYAGHDGAGRMRITLEVRYLGTPSKAGRPIPADASYSDESCRFDSEHPAFLCFQEKLPQLLSKLGLKYSAPTFRRPGTWPVQLPDIKSFSDALDKAALARASDLLFLAMLAPEDSRAAERLFSKAWIELDNLASPDPQLLRMRARIMGHLWQRPYALSLLRNDRSEAADALRAVLNGNLPPLREGLGRSATVWDRFMLGIELHDLELDYGREGNISRKAVLDMFSGDAWSELVAARLGDRDIWVTMDTMTVKKLLDQQYPLPGFGASGGAVGALIVSGNSAAEVELLALRHLHGLIEQQPGKFCCSASISNGGSMDLLDLLDARIERSLSRHAAYQISPQGKYALAVDILANYDAELAGNPYHEGQRLRAYSELLNEGQLQDRESRRTKLLQAAHTVVATEQAQTKDSNLALWHLSGNDADPGWKPLHAYGEDHPIRPFWSDIQNRERDRLAYCTSNLRPLEVLLENSRGDIKLFDDVKDRFEGHPSLIELQTQYLPVDQRSPDRYLPALKRDPDSWNLREALATAYLDRGMLAQIPTTVIGYPLFTRQESKNTVGLSNKAFEWGAKLYEMGAFDLARPLLEKAASYDNGSASSLLSGAYLALMDKDYSGAAAHYLAGAQHYNNVKRYDDLARLMFVTGNDQQAWAVFDQLLSQFRAVPIWNAAMVGNRRAGLSDEQIKNWLASRSVQVGIRGFRDDLSRYAFMEFFTDRTPAADLSTFMTPFVGRAEVIINEQGRVQDRNPRDGDKPRLGPGQFRAAQHAPLKPNLDIPNRYTLLVDAFAKLRSGRPAEAEAAFERLSGYYDLESPEMQFTLPYFALSAAAGSDRFGLRSYLGSLSGETATFGVEMARSVFSALANDPAAAQRSLDAAFRQWADVYRVGNLQSSFVFIDITMQLYELTTNPNYRNQALRMARTIRITDPTDAYASAAVSLLSETHSERVEALATALYLDPRSAWAARAPEELRREAVEWQKKHPPFQLKALDKGL